MSSSASSNFPFDDVSPNLTSNFPISTSAETERENCLWSLKHGQLLSWTSSQLILQLEKALINRIKVISRFLLLATERFLLRASNHSRLNSFPNASVALRYEKLYIMRSAAYRSLSEQLATSELRLFSAPTVACSSKTPARSSNRRQS